MELLRQFRGDSARSSQSQPAGPWPTCSTTRHADEPTDNVAWQPSALGKRTVPMTEPITRLRQEHL
jgi:hypothetical protein